MGKMRIILNRIRRKIRLKAKKRQGSYVRQQKVKRVQVSNRFEIDVRGIPESLTSIEQKQVIVGLLRNGLKLAEDRRYRKGDVIFKGKASISVRGRLYELEYSIKAMRLIEALSVYKAAFDYVKWGTESGQFDPELGQIAANFLKELAWEEILRVTKSDAKFVVKHMERITDRFLQEPEKREEDDE